MFDFPGVDWWCWDGGDEGRIHRLWTSRHEEKRRCRTLVHTPPGLGSKVQPRNPNQEQRHHLLSKKKKKDFLASQKYTHPSGAWWIFFFFFKVQFLQWLTKGRLRCKNKVKLLCCSGLTFLWMFYKINNISILSQIIIINNVYKKKRNKQKIQVPTFFTCNCFVINLCLQETPSGDKAELFHWAGMFPVVFLWRCVCNNVTSHSRPFIHLLTFDPFQSEAANRTHFFY